VRAEASRALANLKHRERLSRLDVARGGSRLLTAKGFLPEHPVGLFIDAHKIVTLLADAHGLVNYQIRPSALGLPPGRHIVNLVSMLITTTNAFHSR
jgi:hypothetical protein